MRKSRSSTSRQRELGSACEGKILARIKEVISRPFVSDQGCISSPGDKATKSVRITNQGFQGFHEPLATNHCM